MSYGQDPKDIWLLLAREGGRWTRGEISDELPHLATRSLSASLYEMVRYGMIVKFEGRPLRFGVMASCSLPRRITVREVIDNGLVPEKG